MVSFFPFLKMIKYGKNSVEQYDLNGNLITKFDSVKAVKIFLDLYPANKPYRKMNSEIYRYIKNGKPYKGYIWKYGNEDFDDEIWKEHSCGKVVSNYGRMKLKNGALSYGSIRTTGYLTASQSGKTYLMHRLILETFDQSNPTMLVDHIDGNRSNNHITNLRWVTPKQNAVGRKPRSTAKHCETCQCIIHKMD